MSRFAAVAAALALVVSGIAIGALLTFLVFVRPLPPHPPSPPPFQPAPFTREMDSRLKLTGEQRRQIQAIIEDGRKESDAIRKELRPRLEKSLAGIRERIGAVLTPEQHAMFDELVREDRRRADRFFLEGPPPPPPGFGPLSGEGPPR